jgi:hypothetical protein
MERTVETLVIVEVVFRVKRKKKKKTFSYDVKLFIGVKHVLKIAAGSQRSVMIHLGFTGNVIIVAQNVDEIQISV